MAEPAFRQLEGDLRSLFGRACKELTSHHADPIGAFVIENCHPKRPSSLENLEYADYAKILERNSRYDKEIRGWRLFQRHSVDQGFRADIGYCKELRHKYNHLAGIGQPVSPREQFSDLVIVKRAVQTLETLRKPNDESKELVSAIDSHLADLVAILAESAASREPTTPAHEPDGGALATEVAKRVVELTALSQTGSPDAALEVIPLLSEIRSSLMRLHGDASQKPSVARGLAAMEERILAEVRAIAELVNKQPLSVTVEAEHDEEREEPVDNDDDSEGTIDIDADELREKLLAVFAAARTLSLDEAREELLALRSRIWEETGSGPSSDGLLRKSMLESFLYHLPQSTTELKRGPMAALLRTVSPEQREYVEDVIGILKRVGAGQ
jgi:hypothetical protein